MNSKSNLFFLLGMISFSQAIVAVDANKWAKALTNLRFWKFKQDMTNNYNCINFNQIQAEGAHSLLKIKSVKCSNEAHLFKTSGNNKLSLKKWKTKKTSLFFMKAEIAKQLYLQKDCFKISQL